jgi:hypothetical protein
VQGLIDTERALRDAGVRLAPHFTIPSSLVMHARNEIVAAFPASEATDLLLIDSDIGWQARDILRLLGHDVPAVAGVCRRKTQAISFGARFPRDGAVQRQDRWRLSAAALPAGRPAAGRPASRAVRHQPDRRRSVRGGLDVLRPLAGHRRRGVGRSRDRPRS